MSRAASRPPGRSSEQEFLSHVGFWFVNSKEARAHDLRIKSFKDKGFVGLRPHVTTTGERIQAYELTDAGLVRLEQISDRDTADRARSHREYLRDQARNNRLL
jgi:hypothetical protein